MNQKRPVSWPAARKCLDLGIDKASVHPFCIVSCGALFHPSFQSSGSLHPEVCSLQPLPWVVEKIYAPILAAEHLLFSTNDAVRIAASAVVRGILTSLEGIEGPKGHCREPCCACGHLRFNRQVWEGCIWASFGQRISCPCRTVHLYPSRADELGFLPIFTMVENTGIP